MKPRLFLYALGCILFPILVHATSVYKMEYTGIYCHSTDSHIPYDGGSLPITKAGLYDLTGVIPLDTVLNEAYLFIPQLAYPTKIYIDTTLVYRWADVTDSDIKGRYQADMAVLNSRSGPQNIRLRFRSDGLRSPLEPLLIGSYEEIRRRKAHNVFFNSDLIQAFIFLIAAISIFTTYYYVIMPHKRRYILYFSCSGILIFFTYAIFLFDTMPIKELLLFRISRISLTLFPGILFLAVLDFSDYYLKNLYSKIVLLPALPISIYTVFIATKAQLVEFHSSVLLYYILPVNILTVTILIYATYYDRKKENLLLIAGFGLFFIGGIYDIYHIVQEVFPPVWLSSYGHALLFFSFIGSIGIHIREEQERGQRYSYELKNALQSLSQIRKQQQQLLNRQDSFIKTLSHEIKTPLSAVVGLIKSLECAGSTPSELSELKTSTNHLSLTVSNLFYYERIQHKKLHNTPVLFSPYKRVQEIIEYNSKKAEEQGNEVFLTVSKNLPEYLVGDVEKVSLITDNLLSNAIKFTHEGKISVKLSYVHDAFSIRVSDTGCGITPSYRSELFYAFNREEEGNISQRYDGLGIGLCIVKHLLKSMDGTLSFSSRKGIGTIFKVKIPLEAGSETTVSPTQKKHLLVAEDNQINRRMICRLLEKMHFQTTAVENGLEAVEIYANSPEEFDLILMDIQMPVMDGFSATEQIHRVNPKAQVIAYTANGEKEECLSAGMAGYITKTATTETIVNTIKTYLP
ncbi:response regulator [Chitinivibrio alkaliphilus]|uniref:histidine kinase n=1 Tax=Chitinivibrio alkaliphilus ACht1 TaxID=1313304 RepID=U7D4I9_9BACT|nr:response regulator [Chitinivibrio alkaliphilus]ERP31424.1 signal transduction histidine kinase [Chitinivibrio alkaliphilus ACht1]